MNSGTGISLLDMPDSQRPVEVLLAGRATPELLNDLVQCDSTFCYGCARREMTILFSDIRGFTTLSETLPPEDVLTFLNEYLSIMVKLVYRHHGIVDKYIGDGMMAIFLPSTVGGSESANAIHSALQMHQSLREACEKCFAILPKQHKLSIGVGIHRGPAVLGWVGAPDYRSFTALGDTVNTASRLVSAAEAGQVVCSESAFIHANQPDIPSVRRMIRVKGKRDEIGVRILI